MTESAVTAIEVVSRAKASYSWIYISKISLCFFLFGLAVAPGGRLADFSLQRS